MKKLAMLLAAIMTLNLVAPAATAYAAPVDTMTEMVADEVTIFEEGDVSGNNSTTSGNDSSASGNNPVDPGNNPTDPGNNPTDPGNNPSVSNNDPSVSNNDPSVSNNDPSVSNNDPSVSNNDPSVSNNDPSVSENDPSVSENEPEDNPLFVQETYYKTSKGYPLVAAFELPIETTYSDLYMLSYFILSVKLSVDGGEAKELTVAKHQVGLNGVPNPETYLYESMSVGFNAGYDKDYNLGITEGVHTLAYEMEFQYAGKTYTVSGIKEVEFEDSSKTAEFVYPSTMQYMSANKGSRVRSIYGDFTVPTEAETITAFKFVNHDTKATISYDVLDKHSYGGYKSVDSRYTEMGGISAWSLFNNDVYSACMYGDIQLRTDIPEGDYDVIFTTSKGKKHIMENAYRATKKAVIYQVDSSSVGYKNYDYSSVPVYADNTGDYVSVFVYGLNITKDTIPAFYADDKSEVLTEYLADDKMCGYEEWENGCDFTVKKKDASREEWESSRPFKVSGDAVYVKLFTVDEKEIKYNCNSKSKKECEWNTSAETFRINLHGKNVSENEVVSVSIYEDWDVFDPLTVDTNVQFDGSNYYIEFAKDSIVYQAVAEQYWRLGYTISDESSSDTYYLWIGDIYKPRVLTNLSVPANHTWEVHAESDVANAVYSGTTTTKKNVLTSSQVAKLAANGLHRVCIFNANGKVVDRYLTYFKAETLYNIEYETNGGENHPDNPTEYGKSDAITLLAPTKEYHSFAGWYTNASFTKKVTKIAKGSSGDKKFYAKWTPYTYTISYNANGGKGTVKSTAGTYNVETTIAKNAFTRVGYNFIGWNTSADGKGDSYTEEQVVKNLSLVNKETVKLYAIWEPIKYTLVLDKNSEDALDGTIEAENNSFDVAYGEVYTLTGEEYVRTGYEITSWKTDAGKKITNGNISNLTTVSGNTVTLSAQWAIDQYTITYNYNGGKVKKANPKNYTYNMASDITLNAPEKKGYVFAGYYEIPQEPGVYTTDEPMVTGIRKGETGDKALYAWWKPIAYTIIFKDTTGAEFKDGITEESIKQPMNYGDVLTFTDAYYQKPGYTLVSWTTKENGKGTKYVSGRGYSNLTAVDGAEITVYANWKKDSYTITYDLDGGKNDKKNPKKYAVDTATITLKEATKKGYSFAGWYLVDEGGQMTATKVDQIIKGSTGNVVLEAKWDPMQYDIVLYRNNNDYPAANVAMSVELEAIAYDENLTPSSWETSIYPSDLWKNQGIGILYWSTKANGSGKKYYPDQTYSGLATEGTVTLYAQWGKIPFAINYDYVGVEATGIKNKNPKTFTYDASAMITLKNVTKTGYVFKGWYTDPSFEEEYKVVDNKLSRNKIEDITLYAWLAPVSYTIKLNPNGSDVTAKDGLDTEFSVKYGATYTLDEDAYTKVHYKFDYWTTKPNGKGIKVTSGTVDKALSTTNGATVNLYPKWELEKYTITYENTAFEGVVNKSPSTYTYNAKKAVKLKNPTRPGYVFGGWYNEDTTEPGFDAATSMKHSTIAKCTAGDIVLYALWTPITYKVKFEANGKKVVLNEEQKNVENVTYGELLMIKPVYSREGYKLVGFNTKKNGKGTMYTPGMEYAILSSKANSTVKLYAIWEKVEAKKVSGVELSADGTRINVCFNSNANCTRYEVAISKYFTMSNAVITYVPTVGGESDISYRSEYLEELTRYYVRVREIHYDSNGNVIYGAWSNIKTIKTGESD